MWCFLRAQNLENSLLFGSLSKFLKWYLLGYKINGFLKNYSCTEIILNHELLLMEQLNFHITVHNPWRPVEGLIIDIKTRLLPGSSHVQKPVLTSEYRKTIPKFLSLNLESKSSCFPIPQKNQRKFSHFFWPSF